jgi:hypothetical protein
MNDPKFSDVPVYEDLSKEAERVLNCLNRIFVHRNLNIKMQSKVLL